MKDRELSFVPESKKERIARLEEFRYLTESRVKELENDMSYMKAVMTQMSENMAQISRDLVAIKTDMDAKFDKMDAKFDKIDTKFDKLDARFWQITLIIITAIIGAMSFLITH